VRQDPTSLWSGCSDSRASAHQINSLMGRRRVRPP
jgi:carbonic anhydrase